MKVTQADDDTYKPSLSLSLPLPLPLFLLLSLSLSLFVRLCYLTSLPLPLPLPLPLSYLSPSRSHSLPLPVPDKHRDNMVVLPWDLESRHRLKHKRPQAAPSWHLLYKDGVTFTDQPGAHDRGELSIYMKDFTKDESLVSLER